MFNGLLLTNKGTELITAMLIGHTIQFTKIKMGNGNQPADVLPLTDLVSVKQTLDVARQSIISSDTILVGGNLFGNTVTEGFQWKEVGVFAKDLTTGGNEVLFSYGYAANPSFIPTGGTVAEMLIDLNVKVGNADNVEIELDHSLIFVTQEELDNQMDVFRGEVNTSLGAITTSLSTHVDNKTNPHEVSKSQVGLGSVENYAIATQTESTVGTSNAKYMTPQRVKQAVEAYSVISDGNLIIKVGGTKPSPQTGKTIIWIDTAS